MYLVICKDLKVALARQDFACMYLAYHELASIERDREGAPVGSGLLPPFLGCVLGHDLGLLLSQRLPS